MTQLFRPRKQLDPKLINVRKDPTLKVRSVPSYLVPYILLEVAENLDLTIRRAMNYVKILHHQLFTISLDIIVAALEKSSAGINSLIFFGAVAPGTFRLYCYWYSRFLFHVHLYRDRGKYKLVRDIDFKLVQSYLFAECRRGLRPSTVRGILSAIKYLLYPHNKQFPFLFEYSIDFKRLFQFLYKNYGIPKVKRRPMTFYILNKILEVISFKKLIDVRDWLVMVLMHVSGPRGNEIAPLLWEDLVVDTYVDTYSHTKMNILILFLDHTKTDPQSEGATITISCPSEKSSFNILLLIKHYIRLLKKAKMLNKWFLPDLNPYAKRCKHINGNTILHITKDRVRSIGLDPKQFGSHSYRTAFVHDAIAAGIPKELIQKTGRWKSNCWLGYFHDQQYAQARATLELTNFGKEFETLKTKKKHREFCRELTMKLGY